jgi:hypothetical protein
MAAVIMMHCARIWVHDATPHPPDGRDRCGGRSLSYLLRAGGGAATIHNPSPKPALVRELMLEQQQCNIVAYLVDLALLPASKRESVDEASGHALHAVQNQCVTQVGPGELSPRTFSSVLNHRHRGQSFFERGGGSNLASPC